ncbi:MAG TPA: DUF2169 domain-containing protein [Syntrophobacteria bacterium]|nr:DUF2169 domain-containing protein [Syntrophobacteria bacterium]
MQIVNETPFSVGTMFWEDLQGKANLSIIVKATFSITKQGAAAAVDQLPLFTTDEHYGDEPLASVRFESDMAPFKPLADVVLVGKAYAPGGRPVARLDVSLRIGGVQRVIRVFGDRKWSYSSKLALVPTISDPKPFVTMDLVYERAFGGIDETAAQYCKENLVGRGFIGKKSVASIDGKLLPNLEAPYNLIDSWKSQPKPAGFGFYGRGWQPRLRHAGTYDEKHERERAPALPLDFSYAIFNGAHPDLQVKGYLHGDEEVELIHLSRDPLLRFRLPGMRPTVRVSTWTVPLAEWMDQQIAEGREVAVEDVPTREQGVESVLDTLVLVPDEGIFYEVFRGVVPLAGLAAPEVACIRITR